MTVLSLSFTNVFALKARAQEPNMFHIAKNQVIEVLDKGQNRIREYTFGELVDEYVEFWEDAADLTLGLASRNYGIGADSIEEIMENGKVLREYLQLTTGAIEDVFFTTGVWILTGSLREAIEHLRFRYHQTMYSHINLLTAMPYSQYYFPDKKNRYESDLASWYQIYEPPVGLHNLDYPLGEYGIGFEIIFPDHEDRNWTQVPTFFQAHDLGLHQNEILIEFDTPVKEIPDDMVLNVSYTYDYADQIGAYERFALIQLNNYETYKIHPEFADWASSMPSPRSLYNVLYPTKPNELRITVDKNVERIELHPTNYQWLPGTKIKRFHVLTEAQGTSFEAVTNFSSTQSAMIPVKEGEPVPEEALPLPEENKPEGPNEDTTPEDGDSSWWNPLNWLWNLLKALLEKLVEMILSALGFLGDILSGLLEAILNVLNAILGFFTDIWGWLTWSEPGYLQTRLGGIKDTFSAKFPSIDDLFPSDFTESTKAPDISINLSRYGIGEQKIVDLNYMQHYFSTFKRWTSAFLYLSTTLVIYKKITGDGVND